MKLLLFSIIVLTALNSLERDPVTGSDSILQVPGNVSPETPENTNLIYEETFEGKTYFPLSGNGIDKAHSIENCKSDWTLSSVGTPVFRGKKACRFEIRKNQPLVGTSQRIRSEVVIIKADEDDRFTPELWYSFSVLFPSEGFQYDDKRDCFNQWFEDGSRETTLRVEKDKAYLEITPPRDSVTMRKYDLFSNSSGIKQDIHLFSPIPKDTWHEFVFHFIHSKKDDGLIEVWRDGVKIHQISGRNMHLKYPKWKIGLYKTSFMNNPSAPGKSSKLNHRVIYFDDIRVGKAAATLADMSSYSN